MAWSTRELAELAGTSLRAVRHYHDQGLLPEPPRSTNGYKHYGVRHLIQLMHIRRLVDLGVPLADIPALDPSTDSYREVLEALASETTAEIDRLVVVRNEIAQLLEEPEAWEMSSGTTGSTDGDFVTVLSRVLDEDSLRAWQRVERRSPTPRSCRFRDPARRGVGRGLRGRRRADGGRGPRRPRRLS